MPAGLAGYENHLPLTFDDLRVPALQFGQLVVATDHCCPGSVRHRWRR